MYKFGISYYQMLGSSRIPISNLEVRLVRPGQTFDSGIILREFLPDSGYYETDRLTEEDNGLYEIWDNKTDGHGANSGKVTIIGKLDKSAFQKACITAEALAEDCVSTMHIKSYSIPFSKLHTDILTANQGKGDQTGHIPAIIGADKYSVHTLEGYTIEPQVILTSMCDTLLFINDIKLDGTKLTINVGIGRPGDNPQLVYNLVLIRV
jgi:hypothetical protein